MKRLYYLVLSLLMAVACAGGSEERVLGDVVLDVKVESPVASDVVVVYHNDVLPFQLDAEGNAQVVLQGVDAAYIKLHHGREMLRLYVEGGDAAALTFKGGRMSSTYDFEGEKQPVVKYLNTVSLIPLPDEDYGLRFEEYVKRLLAKENDALKLLRANDCSKIGDFAKMEEGRIRYSYGAALMMFPVGHKLMAHDMTYAPDQMFYDKIAEYVVEDVKWASLDEYRSFVAEAMHMMDEAGRELRDIYPKTVAQVKYAADFLKISYVRESVIHYITAAYVDNFGVKDITELENLYYTYVKDGALLESMKTKMERWDKSLPGKISPDFKAVDINGKEYTLADFRGKYVYIDMWATWCGPCKREMPYLKALEEEFADAQIVFLGLSIDKDKEAWENMVRTGDLTGVQLYLGTQSKFQEAYKIDGIPRFILLDKDGRIISNDMTRPSEDATAETFRNLNEIR